MLDLDPDSFGEGTERIEARAAAEMLLGSFPESLEVVIRKQRILTSCIVSEEIHPASQSDLSGSCLVAGGAGGLGRELARFLTETWRYDACKPYRTYKNIYSLINIISL